jgi:hypothetical protein
VHPVLSAAATVLIMSATLVRPATISPMGSVLSAPVDPGFVTAATTVCLGMASMEISACLVSSDAIGACRITAIPATRRIP